MNKISKKATTACATASLCKTPGILATAKSLLLTVFSMKPSAANTTDRLADENSTFLRRMRARSCDLYLSTRLRPMIQANLVQWKSIHLLILRRNKILNSRYILCRRQKHFVFKLITNVHVVCYKLY